MGISTFAEFRGISPHEEIVGNPTGIWGVRGDAGAVRRGSGFPIPMGFSVFPSNIEMLQTTETTWFFKIYIGSVMLRCLLWAPRGSFSGTPNFEKLTFPKKCEQRKNLAISLYLWVLAQKQHLRNSGGPKKVTNNCKMSSGRSQTEKMRSTFG